jgi:hypothetical protein
MLKDLVFGEKLPEVTPALRFSGSGLFYCDATGTGNQEGQGGGDQQCENDPFHGTGFTRV